MDDYLIQSLVAVLVLGVFAIEVYLLKRKGKKITLKQTALNFSLGIFDRFVGLFLVGATFIVFDRMVELRFIATMPKGVLSFLVTFFALDLMWYVWHRASHRVSIVWGIHLVHHQSTEFNLSVNFALSSIGFLTRVLFYGTLILFGCPVEYLITSIYISTVYAYFLHTDLLHDFKYINKLFVVPAHHKVHHGSNEEYLDKNYGQVFIIWDRLFGTFEPYKAKAIYGLTTSVEELGVDDLFNVQVFWWRKLYMNFKRYGLLTGIKLLFVGPEKQLDDHYMKPFKFKP
jgi:sterol desaturase/sphingolipid hydroxylase (fatty acid hydroxylase superfamily)